MSKSILDNIFEQVNTICSRVTWGVVSYVSSIYYHYFNDEVVIDENDKNTTKITRTSYNLDIHVLSINYTVMGNKYKLRHSLTNNIGENYIKELLTNESPEKPILTAMINENIDITELANRFCGPNGDFYQNEFKMKVSYLIPIKYHNEFKKLEIIDEMGDMFEYESLNDLLF